MSPRALDAQSERMYSLPSSSMLAHPIRAMVRFAHKLEHYIEVVCKFPGSAPGVGLGHVQFTD